MVLVKICGIKDPESARVAVDHGADLVGMIMVPNRVRTIEPENAKQVVQIVKEKRKEGSRFEISHIDDDDWTDSVIELIKTKGPFSVGVFRNQSLEEINSKIDDIGFDFVQLHGKEPRKEFISQLKVPVITRFIPDDPEIHTAMDHDQILTLFDTESGGQGTTINWNDIGDWAVENKGKYLLAGGLDPENVARAIRTPGVIGVDVASGVETDGVKDHQKIKDFIKNAKTST